MPVNQETIITSTKTNLPKPSSVISAPAITQTPTNSFPTPLNAPGLAADLCRHNDVSVKYGDSDSQNSAVTISVALTNTGANPCVVTFFPNLKLLDKAGEPLDIDYHTFKEASPNDYLLVEPGQPVGFLIVWKNWCQAPLPGGIGLRLTLSDADSPIDISTAGTPLEKTTIYTGAACTEMGKASEAWISQYVYNVPVPLHP